MPKDPPEAGFVLRFGRLLLRGQGVSPAHFPADLHCCIVRGEKLRPHLRDDQGQISAAIADVGGDDKGLRGAYDGPEEFGLLWFQVRQRSRAGGQKTLQRACRDLDESQENCARLLRHQ